MFRILLLAALIGALYLAATQLRRLSGEQRRKGVTLGLLGLGVAGLCLLALLGRIHYLAAAGATLAVFGGRLLRLLLGLPQLLSLWSRLRAARAGADWGAGHAGATGRGASGAHTHGRSTSDSRMTRAQALRVLGLVEGASRDEILAAHRRLIQKVHPDTGGSDFLAAQINQARDLLLPRK